MKRTLFTLLAVGVLAMAFAPAAFAQEMSEPVGSCPVGFMLHHHHEMVGEGEHMHNHIGTSMDQNMDGWICVRMLPRNNHLHVDNSLPLRP